MALQYAVLGSVAPIWVTPTAKRQAAVPEVFLNETVATVVTPPAPRLRRRRFLTISS